MFGVIKKAIKGVPMLTWDSFKVQVERKVRNCKVIDMFAVHDYKQLYQGCIDQKLSLLHKERWTCHQWMFETVEQSIWFPLGVSTMYRAYASDSLIESVEVDLSQNAKTPIGRITGLDHYELQSKWEPSANFYRNRPVQGIFLMKQLPPRGSMMLVKNFDEESVKELPDLMSKLLSQFREDSIERLEWTHFFDRYAPQSKFGSLFYELKRRGLSDYAPLGIYLYNPQVYFRRNSTNLTAMQPVVSTRTAFPDEAGINLLLALALPAVRTEFDEYDHVPVPRIYGSATVSVQNVVNNYKNVQLSVELANVLDGKPFSISLLKGMLFQMTKLDGSEVVKRGSGKVGLIRQIGDQFVNLQKHLYAEILPEVEHFMK